MYLHIGGDEILNEAGIIAILDYTRFIQSEENRHFLQAARFKGALVRDLPEEQRKACIITTDKIYFTSISAGTLVKRSLASEIY